MFPTEENFKVASGGNKIGKIPIIPDCTVKILTSENIGKLFMLILRQRR